MSLTDDFFADLPAVPPLPSGEGGDSLVIPVPVDDTLSDDKTSDDLSGSSAAPVPVHEPISTDDKSVPDAAGEDVYPDPAQPEAVSNPPLSQVPPTDPQMTPEYIAYVHEMKEQEKKEKHPKQYLRKLLRDTAHKLHRSIQYHLSANSRASHASNAPSTFMMNNDLEVLRTAYYIQFCQEARFAHLDPQKQKHLFDQVMKAATKNIRGI